MAKISCPKCEHSFDNNNPEALVTKTAAIAAGALVGAKVCGSMGVLVAPGVGIGGAIPGGLGGALLGFITSDQFRRCPSCGKVFKT